MSQSDMKKQKLRNQETYLYCLKYPYNKIQSIDICKSCKRDCPRSRHDFKDDITNLKLLIEQVDGDLERYLQELYLIKNISIENYYDSRL